MNFWNDLSWVEPLRNPYLTPIFENITLLGYPLFLVLFISFGYFFWSPARFTRVAMLLFISGIINSFLKDYFQDPRPAIEFMLDPKVGTSYGLPSGHAQIAVTLWGLLAYELKNIYLHVGSTNAICFSADEKYYAVNGNNLPRNKNIRLDQGTTDRYIIVCSYQDAKNAGKCGTSSPGLKKPAYLIQWSRFGNIRKYRWSGSDWVR